MTLQAYGTLTHIYASLDRYVASTLSAIEGFAIHQHGQLQFVPPTAEAVWIRTRYDFVAQQRQYYRQVDIGVIGEEVTGAVQLMAAQHWRDWAGRFTLTSARDAIVTHFPRGGLIPVYDYSAQDTPQVGNIFLDTLEEFLLDDGQQSGIVQYPVTVGIRYLETWNQPW